MLEGRQIEPSGAGDERGRLCAFCVDYRRLNSLIVKVAYPLPRIDDSLCLLGNQQWFSAMDLASGYWQVAMSTDAKWKAEFVTHEALYQFWVMPFGLCNAPATFDLRWTQPSELSGPTILEYFILAWYIRTSATEISFGASHIRSIFAK